MVSLRVLGPLELVDDDDRPVALGSALQRRLLTALVLHRGGVVAADALADAIWGDDLPANPANAVQTHVARVRRVLPPGVTIVTDPRGYRLEVPLGTLDVNRFDRLRSEADTEADPLRRAEVLGEAIDLWRGRPYPELDHPSAQPEVARLAETRLRLLEDRARALHEGGRVAEAIAVLDELVGEEPLREGPVALLMRALVDDGRQGDALRAYTRLRTALADELGIDPSPELRTLEEQVLRQELPAASTPGGAPPSPPPRRSARRLPLNLPASSFVGRDDELHAVRQLLDQHRVVTLRGPGGVGKTRLARHVVAASIEAYGGQVTVVDLATIRADDRVPEAVAVALGLEARLDQAVDERIHEVLAIGRQLLVLDCCEQVVDGVAQLVEDVVTHTAAADVLVTSREALRIDAEHVVLLGPLDAPDAHRLFVDRMLAAGAGAPDEADRAVVDEICTALDRLPLAVELAAARVPTLGLVGLRDGLDRRFDLLRNGKRTGTGHHRSLRDVVAWSDELLTPDEREVFHRFSIFAGGVELDHAIEVIADDDLTPARVRAALPDLVDRSLVVTSTASGATTYRLLDTIREYGREQLPVDQSGLRHRFTAWALDLGRRATAGQRNRWESEWARRIDVHLADLLQAHRWLGDDDIAGQLAITAVLGRHAMYRYRLDVARLVDRTVVEHGDRLDPSMPEILACGATLAWQRGRFDEAEALARRAIEVANVLGDPLAGRFGEDGLANVALFRGDHATARRAGQRTIDLAVAADDPLTEMAGYVNVLLADLYAGEDPAAGDAMEARAGELARRLDAPMWLGWFAYLCGERRIEADPDAAVPYLEESVREAERAGATFLEGVARHTLVTHASRSAPPIDAVRSFRPLIDHWHRTGTFNQLWVAVRALVEALTRLGWHREAALLLGAHGASPVAPVAFGADAERLTAVVEGLRAALGEEVDALLQEGAALGDGAAIALAFAVVDRAAAAPLPA